MQRFLLHTYTSIPEVYTILLLRDLKTKKVRHPHPPQHPHQHPNIISLPTTKSLIKHKRIKWTPSRKASHLLPGGKYIAYMKSKFEFRILAAEVHCSTKIK